jgi:hypothetical protein
MGESERLKVCEHLHTFWRVLTNKTLSTAVRWCSTWITKRLFDWTLTERARRLAHVVTWGSNRKVSEIILNRASFLKKLSFDRDIFSPLPLKDPAIQTHSIGG